MSEKIDRRRARTKQLLYQALMSLLTEQGVEHLTVTDITNRADVNRGTFYLHYKDVPDMLEQIKDEVFESIRSEVIQLDFKQAMACADRNEPYPISVAIFEQFALHADFLKAMFGTKGDLSYAHRFRALMAANIYEKMRYNPPSDLAVPFDYLIAYMTSANFGMLMHWIESGMKQTPAQMGAFMTKIINFGPLVAFGLRELPSVSSSSKPH
ncbi:TetR/AcrR family transcriptional regulator [Paenibacillus kobensis]|uniref:TetR/AcrR family transcriptional regulator n=1 Tax=Paenibacillus kobensis TaxID=59841 RepID=UPI000FD925D9|nr:TetR/AcrR family transcriptional regulator [Paenibacillus kobensis]